MILSSGIDTDHMAILIKLPPTLKKNNTDPQYKHPLPYNLKFTKQQEEEYNSLLKEQPLDSLEDISEIMKEAATAANPNKTKSKKLKTS
jgi:predicted house-cleaning noncanonical NTP pyrophosphatase (MazG superfamily)